MVKYCSKNYVFKASIKEQNIIIKDALKIHIFNTFGLVLKIYLTIVNNWVQKAEKLEGDKILFKALEEEDTCIKAESKTSANFAVTKLH